MSTELIRRATHGRLELAQVVWLQALETSDGTSLDDALALVRCAGNRSSVLEHAAVLGRTALRSAPEDEAVAAAIDKVEQAVALVRPAPGPDLR